VRSTETLPTAAGGTVTIEIRSGLIGGNCGSWSCTCGAGSEDGAGIQVVHASPAKTPVKDRPTNPVLTVTRLNTVQLKQAAGAHAAECTTEPEPTP
jgi:hypothetical protein